MDGTPDPDAQEPTPDDPGDSPGPDGGAEGGTNPMSRALGEMHEHLNRIERLYDTGVSEASAELKPIWQKATAGEHRLPVAGAIALAISLQIGLPGKLTFHPVWLLPALEISLLVGLVAANPKMIDQESQLLRAASLLLIAVITIDNGWSASQLIRGLINGTMGSDAGPLLASGAAVYTTNVIAFGLWYWEFDRGGPVARMRAVNPYPDFLFPQMSTEHVAPPDWRPTFIDYLYMSFTNATAFSPTDVLPLTRGAKAMMAAQAGVSLSTVALVVARAVNILK